MIEIVAASPLHVGPLVTHYGPEDADPGWCRNSRRLLRERMRESAYCRSALIDGRPAAMWGVTGELLSLSGHVWLVMTREARTISAHVIIALVRRELPSLLVGKQQLTSFIAANDARGMRFLQFLGFRLADADANGLRRAELDT